MQHFVCETINIFCIISMGFCFVKMSKRFIGPKLGTWKIKKDFMMLFYLIQLYYT